MEVGIGHNATAYYTSEKQYVTGICVIHVRTEDTKMPARVGYKSQTLLRR